MRNCHLEMLHIDKLIKQSCTDEAKLFAAVSVSDCGTTGFVGVVLLLPLYFHSSSYITKPVLK